MQGRITPIHGGDFMVILVVDNDPDQLWELVRNLRHVYPNDIVEYTHDAFMAGRFGINNSVDVLFTKLMMKVDGLKLTELIKSRNPNLHTVLMATREEFDEWDIYEGESEFTLIESPVTKSALREFMEHEPYKVVGRDSLQF